MEGMLELEQEVDCNLESLKQRMIENWLLPGDEQDNQQQSFQDYSANLQFEQWQTNSPMMEQDYAANLQFEQWQTNSPMMEQNSEMIPFTNLLIVSSESWKSGVMNSNNFSQKDPAYMQSSESGGESLFQQLHADFIQNNGIDTAVANIENAALINSGSSCFEGLPGIGNGMQAEQNLVHVSLQKDIMENLLALVSVAERHGLPERRRKIERLPKVETTHHSCQLLSVALASSCNDHDESGAQSDLPHMLVGAYNMQQLQQSKPLFSGSRIQGDQCHQILGLNQHDSTFMMTNLMKEVFEVLDNKIPPETCGINSSADCNNSHGLDYSSSNMSRRLGAGAPMLDCMLSPSVGDEGGDQSWLEIAEPREDLFPRILSLNVSPVVPTYLESPTQPSGVQQLQETGTRAHLPHFASTSVYSEAWNELQHHWDQMARLHRRKYRLPRAAWGG